MSKTFNVFISYSHEDKDVVNELSKQLEAEKITFW